jgi:hypothetical protein
MLTTAEEGELFNNATVDGIAQNGLAHYLIETSATFLHGVFTNLAQFNAREFIKRQRTTTLHLVILSLVEAISMGGPGSGGYKNSPGDIDTHSAWMLIDPLPGTPQVCRLIPHAFR